MSTFAKWLLYLLYSAAVLTVALYYLFPAETIRSFLIHEAAVRQPGYRLDIEAVKPAFPPGLKLSGIHLFGPETGDIPLIKSQALRVRPRPLNPMRSFVFAGQGYGGRIAGRADLKDPSGLSFLDMQISAIRLGQIEALPPLIGCRLEGTLNGMIRYVAQDGSLSATVKIGQGGVAITRPPELPGNMGFLKPVFERVFNNLKTIGFSSVDAIVTLAPGGRLQIRKCTLKGNELGGEISGSVALKRPAAQSMLDITGSIQPHPALIAKLGPAGMLLAKAKTRENGFPFKIEGTVGQPAFSLLSGRKFSQGDKREEKG